MQQIGYLGNPLLKKSGTPIQWTPELLQEYMKCANDPIYFAEKYIKIVHVDRGLIPIRLYDYQKEIIESVLSNRRVIVNTSRQAGKCVYKDTRIRLLDPSGVIQEVTIGSFYELIKQTTIPVDIETNLRFNTRSLIDQTNRKFIESFELENLKIETDTGWQSISHIHKTIEYTEWKLELENDMTLICADDHVVFNENMEEIYVKDLSVGDKIATKNGYISVLSINKTDQKSHMYDITVEHENHRYYTNGILSHNTTTAVVIVLHYVLFNEYKRVALLSNKKDSAVDVLSRIQIAYEELPAWLQQGVQTWNKGSMELENGCVILAASSSSSSIRGKACSFLYIDETAHLENWDEFFSSVYPTISSGKETKILLTSTPNSLNHFWKISKEAQEDVDEFGRGKNGYKYIEVMWDRVPGRDEEWKNDTLAAISWDMEKFAQEYACSFLGSVNTLISGSKLKQLSYTNPLVSQNNISQFKQPEKTSTYVLIADVSRGKGLDYSTFSIIDISKMPYEQVCTFRDNLITSVDFASIIFNMAKLYNNAEVLIEINDIGQQVADLLYMEYEYENVLSTENGGRAGKRISSGYGKGSDRGIRTTKSVKNIGCSILKLLIEQNQLLIHDFNTIQELSRFSRKGASYEAESGAHDDMVMTLVLFAWLSDQEYFKDLTDINTMIKLKEKTQEQLENELLPFGFFNTGLEDDTYERF